MDSTKKNSQHPLNISNRPITTNSTLEQKGGKVKEQVTEFKTHITLLKKSPTIQDRQEVEGTPLFTKVIEKYHPTTFTQYGLFAGMTEVLKVTLDSEALPKPENDPRLFFNISTPSSAFICGSQGSGKSHSLSCFLENCLVKSPVSKLLNPPTGLLFHYDSFISDKKGIPCEAAYLSSNPNINVRVLCSPTNIESIKVSLPF